MAFSSSHKPVSDDILYIRLYIPRPVYLHGYVAPFLVLYLIWLYAWLVIYGAGDYFEAGLIAVAGIGILQILTCLSCFWSVHIRCALTCRSVSSFLQQYEETFIILYLMIAQAFQGDIIP